MKNLLILTLSLLPLLSFSQVKKISDEWSDAEIYATEYVRPSLMGSRTFMRFVNSDTLAFIQIKKVLLRYAIVEPGGNLKLKIENGEVLTTDVPEHTFAKDKAIGLLGEDSVEEINVLASITLEQLKQLSENKLTTYRIYTTEKTVEGVVGKKRAVEIQDSAKALLEFIANKGG